jgi:KUP system potassium uptake protein
LLQENFPMKLLYSRAEWSGIVKALGLVFGDIGTSPIYTLTVIFLLIPATELNVLGMLSLIVWTLVLLVFLEYVLLAMKLEIHGEGGTFILKSILDRYIRTPKTKAAVAVFSFVGVSLLLGDGVITPSVTILSAVEGARLIPGMAGLSLAAVVGISMVIAVILFIFQSKGTDKVAAAFGPVMVIWFLVIGGLGAVSICMTPSVLKALNPYYALQFFMHHGIAGFIILSQVILCATGAEALYADMGHLGRKPIVRAWRLVFVALVLCYLGQGALLLRNPDAGNLLFSVTRDLVPHFYIPFLLLTVFASVIASQALISGVFSIVYQGIGGGAFPRMKVDFTSNRLKSQIYIGAVNWVLMLSVLFMMLLFKKSEDLAVAYGVAVTGTMCITGFMMIAIFHVQRMRIRLALACFVTAVDIIFFAANMAKLEHGGYWSIILASVPFVIILLWMKGQRRVYKNLRPLDLDTFLPGYEQVYGKDRNIPGCALFFVGDARRISPYIIHSMIRSRIIYNRNILLSVHITSDPYGVTSNMKMLGAGLESLVIEAGYKEEVDIEKLIRAEKITYNVIFYGVEDIITESVLWKTFSFMKKNSPSFVQYYKIPPEKLHGVVTRVAI